MKKLVPWLGAAMILVVIFGTIYGVVQQAQRRDANWPQVQIAEDAATALDKGGQPDEVVNGNVDVAHSLAPFTVIYDKSGQPVGGSGYLDGKLPAVPVGVLKAAHGQDYHFVTWQPQGDVRIAAVTVEATDYYVLSGRSLKEVERNEAVNFRLSLVGGVVALAVLVAAFGASQGTRSRK